MTENGELAKSVSAAMSHVLKPAQFRKRANSSRTTHPRRVRPPHARTRSRFRSRTQDAVRQAVGFSGLRSIQIS